MRSLLCLTHAGSRAIRKDLPEPVRIESFPEQNEVARVAAEERGKRRFWRTLKVSNTDVNSEKSFEKANRDS